MPEGHTIHRLARDLARDLAGSTVAASSPQGRFSEGALLLDGGVPEGFEAYGKHLLGHWQSGETLHIHLGLIGKFKRAKGAPVGQVRLRLEGAERTWDLRGPYLCEVGTPDLAEAVAAKIGPDPLRPDFDAETVFEMFARRKKAIGAVLLDQNVIAGIGNVYRAEFLFLEGIDPRTPARELDREAVSSLCALAVEQLRLGVRLNRIVTTDPADAGYPNHRGIPKGERLYVYKREGLPCRTCDTEIEVLDLGGRRIAHCPTCQN